MSAVRPLALLTAPAWLLVIACSATPVPEPPDAVPPVNPELVDLVSPESYLIVTTGTPRGVELAGQPNAAQPGCTVRATNLDTLDPAVSSSVAADGSFVLAIPASIDAELRLQVVCPDLGRSQPVDFRVLEAAGLAPVSRLGCLDLAPGLALDFGQLEAEAETRATLILENACDGPVALSNPRLRLGLGDFVAGALPAEIAAGTSEAVEVRFVPPLTGAREDVLFFDVTLDAEPVRYAVTLAGYVVARAVP